jgi:hypothetical protein
VEKSKFVAQKLLCTMILSACVCVLCCTQAVAQQVEIKDAPAPPSPPKVSSYAPAKDLVNQLQAYVKDIEATLETEQEYKDTEGKIGRCASTMAVIALCLGLHDEENQYKSNAAALIKAAQELAATTDYQSAKKAFDGVKAAVDGKVPAPTGLKWEKVASLPDLMKQVPNINTNLKRNIKGAKFKSKAKLTAGYTATIAAIGQGSIADVSKAKKADEVRQWYEYMIMMRDSAGAVNAAIHSGNEPAAAEAMKKLTQSCDDCHKVFHPAALLVEEKAE